LAEDALFAGCRAEVARGESGDCIGARRRPRFRSRPEQHPVGGSEIGDRRGPAGGCDRLRRPSRSRDPWVLRVRTIRRMTEVAQALLLPSVEGPGIASLLSAALIWDRVLVPRSKRQSSQEEGRPAALVLERLEDEGVVHQVALQLDGPHVPQPRGGFHAINQALASGVAERMTAPKLEARVWAALQEATNEVADHQSARLRSAVDLCGNLGAAPVANGLFALIAPILPLPTTGAPVREGTLMSIAAQGIGVDDTTNVEEVLRFRGQHGADIGRLRASLIDLAATIRQDSPPLALLEEARAVLSNRVEPALASLEALLKEGRVRYLWRTMFGTAAVASTSLPTTAAAAAAVGAVATRSISYVFDRERLVREHPYGYLHQVRSEFGSPGGGVFGRARPITDPEDEMRSFFREIVGAALGPEIPKYVAQALARPLEMPGRE